MNRARRTFVVAAALLLVCAVNATAQSSFSGTLASDTTWTLANSPIQVTGKLQVPAGVTLTIQPGVIVRFA